MTNEEYEYQKFFLDFTLKSREIGEEYEKLSDSNKKRFQEEVKSIIGAEAFSKLLMLFRK